MQKIKLEDYFYVKNLKCTLSFFKISIFDENTKNAWISIFVLKQTYPLKKKDLLFLFESQILQKERDREEKGDHLLVCFQNGHNVHS